MEKLKELKDLQTAPLSQVLNKPVEVVCALRPFQTMLYSDGPFRDRVNFLLAKVNFGIVAENDWAFVFVLGDSVSVQKVNGYQDDLYLATGNAGLADTFKPIECTTIDRARIVKVSRSVVCLGEER